MTLFVSPVALLAVEALGFFSVEVDALFAVVDFAAPFVAALPVFCLGGMRDAAVFILLLLFACLLSL